jgi:hypothetical protein
MKKNHWIIFNLSFIELSIISTYCILTIQIVNKNLKEKKKLMITIAKQ